MGPNVAGSAGSGGRCYWRFADFDNLEENNDRFQGYGEFNLKFANGMHLHIEGLYGQTNVHNVPQSVSYLPNQFPGLAGAPTPGLAPSKTIGVGPSRSPVFDSANFYIPVTNPGLATLRTLNPATVSAALTANGVYAGALIWRALGIGGNSFFSGKGQLGQREQDTYRISAALEGDFSWFNNTHWSLALTQSEANATQVTPDMLVDRLQLALRGLGSRLGSTQCDPATGTPGVGNCFYLNPFSTGVAKQAITGAVNPQFAAAVALDPRVVNDPAMIGWVYGPDSQLTVTGDQEFVVDGVMNGTMPVKLWADDISWALGFQYRKDTYYGRYGAFTDNDITPCIDTILTGTTTCAVRNGPYGFYGNYAPYHLSGETRAVFGELDVPVTSDIAVQLAARYEKIYGGKDTFNPKASVRWQVTDWLALRASGGSTFRAPPLGSLVPNPVTILAFSPAGGAYLAFDTFGNGGTPAGTVGLSPEKAKNFNVGAIVNWENFSGTLDFWHFDFQNPLGTESGNAILGAIFPNAPASFVTGNNCANPAFAALINRVTFNSAAATQQLKCLATTSVSNIARVHVNTINGGSQMTQGIDYSLQYIWPDAIQDGDAFTFQALGTYNLNYQVSAQVVEGITLIPQFEAAGELNVGIGAVVSLPRLKASLFAQYANGPHNLRFTMNYIGSMADSNNPIASRRSIFTVPQAGFAGVPPDTTPCLSTAGATVAPWITFDLDLPVCLDGAEPAVQPDDRQHPGQGSALRPYRLFVRRVHGQSARPDDQVRDHREAELSQTFNDEIEGPGDQISRPFFCFPDGVFDVGFCALPNVRKNPGRHVMKFYNSVGPNPRVVRMFMAEKGITIPTQDVNLMAGENRQDEHLKRNPHGQMPCLELDDGSVSLARSSRSANISKTRTRSRR